MSSSGLTPIFMPKWGLAMDEGTVVEWLIDAGSPVSAGDDLVEIETTKITNVFEAPQSGVLCRRVVEPGETVPVGALIGVVAQGDVDDAEIDSFVTDFQANFVPAEEGEGEQGVREATVEVAGRRLSYLAAGPGGDGAEGAVPAILIHGFGGDANNWLFNIDELAQDRAVYALDLPGHGKSTKDVGDGSVAELARAVAGFMDALDIPRAHVAGHSLGAAVAFALLADDPARVASIAGIAPVGLAPRINGAFIQGFIAAERRKDYKTVLANLFADPSLVSRDMIEGVQRFKRLEGAVAGLRAIADRVFPDGGQAISYGGVLASCGKPLLLMWGTADAVIEPPDPADMPATSSVKVLDDVGHMPHMEAASTVNAELRRHFGEGSD